MYGVVHAWMERALADGTLQPRPLAKVVGKGLEAVQTGMDMLKEGVSAVKLVVNIEQLKTQQSQRSASYELRYPHASNAAGSPSCKMDASILILHLHPASHSLIVLNLLNPRTPIPHALPTSNIRSRRLPTFSALSICTNGMCFNRRRNGCAGRLLTAISSTFQCCCR